LNEFLKLSSYAPAHTQQIIPMAAIRQPNCASSVIFLRYILWRFSQTTCSPLPRLPPNPPAHPAP
jgi:hypothetical protein